MTASLLDQDPVGEMAVVEHDLENADQELAPTREMNVEIIVTSDAWVQITNEHGKAILSRVLKEGDRYIVPKEGQYTLDTGNIGGLMFAVNGYALPVLGKRGDVLRGLPLDGSKMLDKAGLSGLR